MRRWHRLIRSIAELVMHQSLVSKQIPRQDERLDKFIYDLLNGPQPDTTLSVAEARLFEIDLRRRASPLSLRSRIPSWRSRPRPQQRPRASSHAL